MNDTTDRELLESAAEAFGYQLLELANGVSFNHINTGGFDKGNWNPLHDDGDALRLAVATKNMNLSDLVEFLILSGQTNELTGAALVRRAIVWAVSQSRKGIP